MTSEHLEMDLHSDTGLMASGIKLCSHLGSSLGQLEDKFEELAGNMFQHCNSALDNDSNAPYEVAKYPIAESQAKRHLENQLSQK